MHDIIKNLVKILDLGLSNLLILLCLYNHNLRKAIKGNDL